MDITKIDNNDLEFICLWYTVAKDVFGVEPCAASTKTKKKIRKWIYKTYIVGADYSQEVMNYVAKEVSDKEFFDFLKVCYDQIQLYGTNKKQIFDKNSADLAEDVKNAIWALLNTDAYCARPQQEGTQVQFVIDNCEAFDRTLILLEATDVPQGDYDCLSFENGSLLKEGDEYKLVGETIDYGQDACIPFVIRFTNAKVHIRLYKATETFNGTPWLQLESICSAILDKYFLSGECFNDYEKEILPLLVEISKLTYWARIPEQYKDMGFSCLISYMTELGYTELIPLIEEIEKGNFSNGKKQRKIDKLMTKLNNQKYEPLWRKIFDIVVKSQENYPAKVSMYCSRELLNEIRDNIQRYFESQGYLGEYPDFVKKGTIQGIHLAESYDKSYFVGAEKNVVYHIHCVEEYFNEHLMINFICGTEILRKDERMGDAFACLFDAKGRHLYQVVSYESGYINKNGKEETDDLELRTQIAVKRAELKKLTKEEREAVQDLGISKLLLLFFVFVFMGGFFALFMTMGFMLMEVLLCLIFGMPREISVLFAETPWWMLFASVWVLFGGAMGIITILAKRK